MQKYRQPIPLTGLLLQKVYPWLDKNSEKVYIYGWHMPIYQGWTARGRGQIRVWNSLRADSGPDNICWNVFVWARVCTQTRYGNELYITWQLATLCKLETANISCLSILLRISAKLPHARLLYISFLYLKRLILPIMLRQTNIFAKLETNVHMLFERVHRKQNLPWKWA